MSRNRFNMQGRTREAMSEYYLEKMLSESAQFRAYNDYQKQQAEDNRMKQSAQRSQNMSRLRQRENEVREHPVVGALTTLFGPAKKSA